MLMAMRRGAAGWVAKILFGLLILSFAVWGIGDYLTPEVDPVIANVGEIEIKRSTLDQAERQQLERMRQLLGPQFNAANLPEDAVRQAALEQLLGQAALDAEATNLGLAVSIDGAREAIQNNPQFQTGGAFDADAFRRTLFAAGMTEDAYVSALMGELVRTQLASAVAAQVPPPLPLAEAMFVHQNQRRAIAFARLNTEGVEAPTPTDAELKAYVEANAVQFAEQERRDARAIIVSEQAIAAAIEISDTEVANRYEDTKNSYASLETRVLVQALFQDESEALAFAVSPQMKGDAFRELAEASGAIVTDLGEMTRGQVFPAAVGDAVFATDAGVATRPVKTGLGWHVVLVAEVNPAATRPLADVADEIREAMRQERALDGLTDFANSVEDALAAGGDLEGAARSAGLPVTNLKGIDRLGVNRDGETSPILPTDPNFLSDLFERPTGEQSGLIELTDGSFVAVIVDATHATAPKAFETVREDATRAWTDDKRKEIAAGRLAALMEASEKSSFEAAAAQIGVEVETSELVGETDMAAATGLGLEFIGQVFSAKQGETLQTETPAAVIVAIVHDVFRPAFNPNGDDEKTFLRELAGAYANDRVQTLAQLARDAHPPSISGGAMTSIEEAHAAMQR